ncbi:galactose-1-phosphate uridylyltransferase, partial [Coprococcus eutactus]|nr:galactose-1-phosphate uridylyltransferase [Coprococcus eutactus]
EDRIYTTNTILVMMKKYIYEEPGVVPAIDTPEKLEECLKGMLDYAVENGLITEDSVVLIDLFDTKILNALVPKPSQLIKTFREKYAKS